MIRPRTIVAIATALGPSAIGVVRLSGAAAPDIARRLLGGARRIEILLNGDVLLDLPLAGSAMTGTWRAKLHAERGELLGEAFEIVPGFPARSSARRRVLGHGRADAREGALAFLERRDPEWSLTLADDWPDEIF